MNGLAVFILASLVVKFAIELIADWLNLWALQSRLPEELKGLYNPEDYRKSQKYLRAVTASELVKEACSLAVILAFWFLGGFRALDGLVRGWGFPPIVDGLLYIGILYLAYYLILLPFGVHHTFVIERRFGFNRSTPATFVKDRVKMLILGGILGGILLAAALALFQYIADLAWVYCWLGLTVFSLFIQFIAPTWIMPLFNKFTPLPAGELREAILAYSRSADFPVKNIFVMDGSRRSAKSNAFFTGLGHNKRIALFDTLIEKHNAPELVAVLAHEIGHYKKRHITQGIFISVITGGLTLFLFSVFLNQPALYQAFYLDQSSIYTGMLFFNLLFTFPGLILSVITNSLSRRNEYAADRFAAETLEDSRKMLDALKKLSTSNLANPTPHSFYVFLNYSHPPLLQRLKAIETAIQEK
jgi:STE24 endopeptidase